MEINYVLACLAGFKAEEDHLSQPSGGRCKKLWWVSRK